MNASVIAVVGLKREAALVAGSGVSCVVGGGDGAGLQARLVAAVARTPCRAIVSVGLAGALTPRLKLGEWVVAECILSGDRAWATDPKLKAELRQALPSASSGAVAASDVMLADAKAKAALYAATGALAVDMESHVAARFAAAHNLPFAALRVISDAADRALPRAAQAGMKKDGGMDVLAVLRELAKDPRQFPALIRTGREAEVAFAKLALLGRHDLLGRLGVGDPDLGQLALDVV